MRKAKIKNDTGRMLVVQIAAAHSAAGMSTKTTRIIRFDRHRDGVVRPRKVRVQFPPVLRLMAGATSDPLPVDILRDPNMKSLRRSGGIKVEYVDGNTHPAPTQPHVSKKAEASADATVDKSTSSRSRKRTKKAE